MIILVITLLLAAAIVIAWYKESRIFLFLMNKIVFPHRTGAPVNIDKSTAFPQSAWLEKKWPIIYQELQQVLNNGRPLPKLHELDPANHKISFDNAPAWRTIILKAYNGWFTENCNLFPETTAMLKKIRHLETALFSILEPHVQIPPHCGKFSGILRYHLGLVVPSTGQCYIEVNGEKYFWKQGEGMLFNDTYVHSVSNDSDEYRIILFLDIKKKSSLFIRLLDQLMLYFVRLSPTYKRAVRSGKIID